MQLDDSVRGILAHHGRFVFKKGHFSLEKGALLIDLYDLKTLCAFGSNVEPAVIIFSDYPDDLAEQPTANRAFSLACTIPKGRSSARHSPIISL